MPSHRELFDDNLRNKYLNKGNYHMDQQELTQCETPTVSSARKGKWPVFVLYLIGSEWREFSGTILEWSKEKVVSGVVICEYTFDAFRHQRKNKQAKEKKEEKKILSCRWVSLYYVGCLWNSHGSLHVKDWFSYTLTITLVAKLTYSFVIITFLIVKQIPQKRIEKICVR